MNKRTYTWYIVLCTLCIGLLDLPLEGRGGGGGRGRGGRGGHSRRGGRGGRGGGRGARGRGGRGGQGNRGRGGRGRHDGHHGGYGHRGGYGYGGYGYGYGGWGAAPGWWLGTAALATTTAAVAASAAAQPVSTTETTYIQQAPAQQSQEAVWHIKNDTESPLTISTGGMEKTIAPGQAASVPQLEDSFEASNDTGDITVQTNDAYVLISEDAQGNLMQRTGNE